MNSPDPIEPDDSASSRDRLLCVFPHSLSGDREWLADLLVRLRQQLGGKGDHAEAIARGAVSIILSSCAEQSMTRDAMMVRIIAALEDQWPLILRVQHPTLPLRSPWLPRPLLRTCCQEIVSHGVSIEDGLKALWQCKEGRPVRLPYLAQMFYCFGVVDPARLIDDDSVLRLAAQPNWMPQSWGGSDWYTNTLSEPLPNVSTWLRLISWRVLRHLLPRFRALPDEQAAEFARGLSHALAFYLATDFPKRPHFLSFHEAGPSFWRFLMPFFLDLDRRVAGKPPQELLARMWMRYAWMACPRDQTDHDLPEETRVRLAGVAVHRMAQLRSTVAAADDRKFVAEWPDRQDMLYLLGACGDAWEAIKPLLLMLRALPVPSVCSDLRYWSEPGLPEVPPEPWSEIPQTLLGTLHWLASLEQEVDPWLRDLRAEFAGFLLERLQTKPRRKLSEEERRAKNGEPVFREPSATWRRYCARALRELHIDPGHEGHRILRFSAQHDPDPKVREEAEQSSRFLQRSTGQVPDGTSPRRAIIRAFWFLLQAHVIETGGQIWPEGALRTLDREVRRTQDMDLVIRNRIEGGTAEPA